MANKSLFASRSTPPADTKNLAGGAAYSLPVKVALAQIACTNCFNGTYYATPEYLLQITKELVDKLIGEKEWLFLAKLAVYARRTGFMKDMPAFILAVLCAQRQYQLVAPIFTRVLNNGRMLRTFVQIARSGAAGRKINFSGRAMRRMLTGWFHWRNTEALFRDSVGNDPSLADVIRMSRPKPINNVQAAFFGYLIGKEINHELLPTVVQQYEQYKKVREGEVPNVEFRLLDSLGLGKQEWTQIARTAPWQMTRMNLRTFQRHGVFDSKELVAIVADRLRDRDAIMNSNVFPYQLLIAYIMTAGEVPGEIGLALQDALDICTEKAPAFARSNTVLAVDVSSSMTGPVTGERKGIGTKVTCLHAAALYASALLRRNPLATVLPFSNGVMPVMLNPRDSVLTNANVFLRLPHGGTDCAAPLEQIVRSNKPVDQFIFLSDNESWIRSGSSVYRLWETLRRRNPKAKMACIDITPNKTAQNPPSPEILNVAGFSDGVFTTLADFFNKDGNQDTWLREIDQTPLGGDAPLMDVVEESEED